MPELTLPKTVSNLSVTSDIASDNHGRISTENIYQNQNQIHGRISSGSLINGTVAASQVNNNHYNMKICDGPGQIVPGTPGLPDQSQSQTQNQNQNQQTLNFQIPGTNYIAPQSQLENIQWEVKFKEYKTIEDCKKKMMDYERKLMRMRDLFLSALLGQESERVRCTYLEDRLKFTEYQLKNCYTKIVKRDSLIAQAKLQQQQQKNSQQLQGQNANGQKQQSDSQSTNHGNKANDKNKNTTGNQNQKSDQDLNDDKQYQGGPLTRKASVTKASLSIFSNAIGGTEDDMIMNTDNFNGLNANGNNYINFNHLILEQAKVESQLLESQRELKDYVRRCERKRLKLVVEEIKAGHRSFGYWVEYCQCQLQQYQNSRLFNSKFQNQYNVNKRTSQNEAATQVFEEEAAEARAYAHANGYTSSNVNQMGMQNFNVGVGNSLMTVSRGNSFVGHLNNYNQNLNLVPPSPFNMNGQQNLVNMNQNLTVINQNQNLPTMPATTGSLQSQSNLSSHSQSQSYQSQSYHSQMSTFNNLNSNQNLQQQLYSTVQTQSQSQSQNQIPAAIPMSQSSITNNAHANITNGNGLSSGIDSVTSLGPSNQNDNQDHDVLTTPVDDHNIDNIDAGESHLDRKLAACLQDTASPQKGKLKEDIVVNNPRESMKKLFLEGSVQKSSTVVQVVETQQNSGLSIQKTNSNTEVDKEIEVQVSEQVPQSVDPKTNQNGHNDIPQKSGSEIRKDQQNELLQSMGLSVDRPDDNNDVDSGDKNHDLKVNNSNDKFNSASDNSNDRASSRSKSLKRIGSNQPGDPNNNSNLFPAPKMHNVNSQNKMNQKTSKVPDSIAEDSYISNNDKLSRHTQWQSQGPPGANMSNKNIHLNSKNCGKTGPNQQNLKGQYQQQNHNVPRSTPERRKLILDDSGEKNEGNATGEKASIPTNGITNDGPTSSKESATASEAGNRAVGKLNNYKISKSPKTQISSNSNTDPNMTVSVPIEKLRLKDLKKLIERKEREKEERRQLRRAQNDYNVNDQNYNSQSETSNSRSPVKTSTKCSPIRIVDDSNGGRGVMVQFQGVQSQQQNQQQHINQVLGRRGSGAGIKGKTPDKTSSNKKIRGKVSQQGQNQNQNLKIVNQNLQNQDNSMSIPINEPDAEFVSSGEQELKLIKNNDFATGLILTNFVPNAQSNSDFRLGENNEIQDAIRGLRRYSNDSAVTPSPILGSGQPIRSVSSNHNANNIVPRLSGNLPPPIRVQQLYQNQSGLSSSHISGASGGPGSGSQSVFVPGQRARSGSGHSSYNSKSDLNLLGQNQIPLSTPEQLYDHLGAVTINNSAAVSGTKTSHQRHSSAQPGTIKDGAVSIASELSGYLIRPSADKGSVTPGPQRTQSTSQNLSFSHGNGGTVSVGNPGYSNTNSASGSRVGSSYSLNQNLQNQLGKVTVVNHLLDPIISEPLPNQDQNHNLIPEAYTSASMNLDSTGIPQDGDATPPMPLNLSNQVITDDVNGTIIIPDSAAFSYSYTDTSGNGAMNNLANSSGDFNALYAQYAGSQTIQTTNTNQQQLYYDHTSNEIDAMIEKSNKSNTNLNSNRQSEQMSFINPSPVLGIDIHSTKTPRGALSRLKKDMTRAASQSASSAISGAQTAVNSNVGRPGSATNLLNMASQHGSQTHSITNNNNHAHKVPAPLVMQMSTQSSYSQPNSPVKQQNPNDSGPLMPVAPLRINSLGSNSNKTVAPGGPQFIHKATGAIGGSNHGHGHGTSGSSGSGSSSSNTNNLHDINNSVANSSADLSGKNSGVPGAGGSKSKKEGNCAQQ